MKYYYAPMEGITGFIQRGVHHQYFPGLDAYYAPFISPNDHGKLTTKERNDILPEHNEGLTLIPQILTNKASCFLACEKTLMEYGYHEINLNLGCPSKTVTSKYRGAGFLSKPDELDEFLYEIYSKTNCKISIKTRTGMLDTDGFEDLIEIYNKYPVCELTVHPRTQKDFYKNTPDREMYRIAYDNRTSPICYNGDIFGKDSYKSLLEDFPETNAVMMGRGLLMNPDLVSYLETGRMPEMKLLKNYHDGLCEAYQKFMPGDKVVLYKMKELWLYFIRLFEGSDKIAKKIKKSQRLSDYKIAVNDLFRSCEVRPVPENTFLTKKM